jgi:hypothetical protein
MVLDSGLKSGPACCRDRGNQCAAGTAHVRIYEDVFSELEDAVGQRVRAWRRDDRTALGGGGEDVDQAGGAQVEILSKCRKWFFIIYS